MLVSQTLLLEKQIVSAMVASVSDFFPPPFVFVQVLDFFIFLSFFIVLSVQFKT